MNALGGRGNIDEIDSCVTRLRLKVESNEAVDDGELEKLVCEAVSNRSNENLYWHMDEQFIAQTNSIHQQSMILEPGKHVLTVMDGDANSKSVVFEILSK